MSEDRLDLEFIKRCMQPEFQKQAMDWYKFGIWKSNKCQRDNTDKHNNNVRKYAKTAMGAYSNSKRNYLRRVREKIASLDISREEKRAIGEFYNNCPSGYEVDHIRPISKGGLHTLSNLQYLTCKENRQKSAKYEVTLPIPDRHLSIPYLQMTLKCSYEEAESVFLKSKKVEEVALRPFNKHFNICPECLNTYTKFQKNCDLCPNEEIRKANKKTDERLKKLGLYC